jgi:hypothetical protein
MARQKKATTRQPVKKTAKPDRYPLINDWLEFTILVVASFGVGGGIFALIYLAHVNGAI